jgi:hypothetical protein
MDTAIVAGLIAAGATVLAAIITTTGYLYIELRKLRQHPPEDDPPQGDAQPSTNSDKPTKPSQGSSGGESPEADGSHSDMTLHGLPDAPIIGSGMEEQ